MNFDPAQRTELARQAKQALRRRVRALRQALPPGAVQQRSDRITHHLTQLAEVQQATRIGLFWPIAKHAEVDLRPFDGWLRERRRQLFYPFMDAIPGGARTGFRLVHHPDELQLRGHSFREPPPNAEEAPPASLDLVVVPALAVDPRGHRLGHGSGFYDVTLPEQCPPAIAVVVAFHFQLLIELPVEAHDRAAHVVITDETTIRPEATPR